MRWLNIKALFQVSAGLLCRLLILGVKLFRCIEKWLKDAKAMVKDRAYQSSPYAGSSYRGSSYGGYYGGGSSYYGGGSSYGKTETKSENKSSGKKKGKRKGKKSGAFNNASTSDDDEKQLTMLYGGWGEDGDYADPYYAQ